MVVEIMIYYSFIYIALSCLILSKLSINVIKLRRQNKVSFGDDGDRTLMRRIRAQANFIEYTPIFLLSLIGIEWLAVENIPYYFLYINIAGSLFIIGRINISFCKHICFNLYFESEAFPNMNFLITLFFSSSDFTSTTERPVVSLPGLPARPAI